MFVNEFIHVPLEYPLTDARMGSALRQRFLGRGSERGEFAQERGMHLSSPNPTVPRARIRALPAASRLPALLRSRRPAAQLRPCRQGARRHPARRRLPRPHAGEPSRRRALPARAPRRHSSTAGAAPTTRRFSESSSTSSRPPSVTATAGASAAVRGGVPALRLGARSRRTARMWCEDIITFYQRAPDRHRAPPAPARKPALLRGRRPAPARGPHGPCALWHGPHTEPGEVAVEEHPVAALDREPFDPARATSQNASLQHAPASIAVRISASRDTATG